MMKNNDKIGERLLDIKKQIEDAKTKKARYEGRLQELYNELQKGFGCKTIRQAERKLNEYDTQIEKMQSDLEVRIEKLEEDYDWEI